MRLRIALLFIGHLMENVIIELLTVFILKGTKFMKVLNIKQKKNTCVHVLIAIKKRALPFSKAQRVRREAWGQMLRNTLLLAPME